MGTKFPPLKPLDPEWRKSGSGSLQTLWFPWTSGVVSKGSTHTLNMLLDIQSEDVVMLFVV